MADPDIPDPSSESVFYEELLYLRDFREKILNFIGVFCGYDLGEPSIAVRASADLLLQPPELDPDLEWKIRILRRKIQHLTDRTSAAVGVASLERRSEDVDKNVEPEGVDLKSILHEHVLFAQRYIEEQQRITHLSDLEFARKNIPAVVRQNRVNPNVVARIPDDLPNASGNQLQIHHSIKLLTTIAVKHHYTGEIAFETRFDDQFITVTVRYSSGLSADFMNQAFQQFPSAHTGFAFTDDVLSLYLSWKLAHVQGGWLDFEAHDQSICILTLALPRAS